MITAQAVSRTLGKTFTKSKYLASGRVSGWGITTSGYEVKQGPNAVFVTYWFGENHRHHTYEEQQEKRKSELAAMAKLLTEKNYIVTQDKQTLIVSKAAN